MKFSFHGAEKWFPTEIYFNFAKKIAVIGTFLITLYAFTQRKTTVVTVNQEKVILILVEFGNKTFLTLRFPTGSYALAPAVANLANFDL